MATNPDFSVNFSTSYKDSAKMGSWFCGSVFKLPPSLGAFSRNQWARNEEGKITN